MNTLQKIYSEYLENKHWLEITKPSLQVKCFEKRLPLSSLILDIGSGAGLDAIYLRERGHDVVTSDLEPSIADVLCDVENMPFGSQRFDGVFCRGVLHLCANIDKAFTEILRVSKTNSILLLSYALSIIREGNEMKLGKRLSYRGRAKVLYEHISYKNHINHSHVYYLGVLRNVIL